MGAVTTNGPDGPRSRFGRRRRPVLTSPNRVTRPLVIAHRGDSTAAAEHTLSAYQQALDEGVDGLECDVRLTADGHLVCMHDRRVDRTSNGRGTVSTLELADLQQLDWSSWSHPWSDLDDEAPDRDEETHGVLTLERLCSLIEDYERPVDLAIETKHPTRYAGLVERTLVELLDRHGWARPRRGRSSPARVMSFSWLSLRRVLEMAPGLPTVFLMDRVPLRYKDGTLPLGAQVAGPSIDYVRDHPSYVERAHAAGHEVHTWVVNADPDMELCTDLGVDALITDRPGAAVRRLRAREV
jgi:glycerophosphoryl diester phosphodiesterase